MNGHPTREEDFDLYALGALEGDERQQIESHAASCADCTRRLAEAQGRIALLALAAPQVEPSPAVKQRLMQQVRGAAERAAPMKAAPERGSRGNWWAAILIPATAVLVLATILLWNETRALNQQLASLHASMEQQQQQLDEARAVADLIADPATVVIPLAQQAGAPRGRAHVIYNATLRRMIYEDQLEPAPAGKSYQLWVVPAQGSPISAGVFNPANGQTDHVAMNVPPGVTLIAFAVTLEPAGGAPQPTGPKVLVGSVS